MSLVSVSSPRAVRKATKTTYSLNDRLVSCELSSVSGLLIHKSLSVVPGRRACPLGSSIGVTLSALSTPQGSRPPHWVSYFRNA